jgi:hypothetical protein
MKTPSEFEAQAAKVGMRTWILLDCPMCEYPCGFLFEDGNVFYDSGCSCTGRDTTRETSWNEVAEHYNRQCLEVQREYDQFWSFP